jgi:hypothetical protein
MRWHSTASRGGPAVHELVGSPRTLPATIAQARTTAHHQRALRSGGGAMQGEPSTAAATAAAAAAATTAAAPPPQQERGLLARLLAPSATGRNGLLTLLGYYSKESRAIGAGNILYKQAVRRSAEAAAAEAGPEPPFATRFEMLSLHVYLILRRLRAEKGSPLEAEISQAMQTVFDLLWTDVRNRMLIKEQGMKLIESGKWVKECEMMFFGLAVALDECFDPINGAVNSQKLEEVLARNVTCVRPDKQRITALRKYILLEKDNLDHVPVDQLWESGVNWRDSYRGPPRIPDT